MSASIFSLSIPNVVKTFYEQGGRGSLARVARRRIFEQFERDTDPAVFERAADMVINRESMDPKARDLNDEILRFWFQRIAVPEWTERGRIKAKGPVETWRSLETVKEYLTPLEFAIVRAHWAHFQVKFSEGLK